MASTTIKTDSNNDLYLVDGRHFGLISGEEACAQSIRSAGLMRKGEDIYNTEDGVDYLGVIFVQNSDLDLARQQLSAAISKHKDVLSIESLSIDMNGNDMNWEARVMTTYGILTVRNAA